MSDSVFSLPEVFGKLLILGVIYLVPVALVFLLLRSIIAANRESYTFQNFVKIILPGFFYCIVESFYPRQEFNFVSALFPLLILAVGAMFIIRKINWTLYIAAGSVLAVILWQVLEKGTLKLF